MAGRVVISQEERERPEIDCCSEIIEGNELQQQFFKKLVSAKGYTVMVAGQPRKGKSTALNNFLGMKLRTGCGVDSVTKIVTKSSSSQHGVYVCGIDAPGLQAKDVDTKKTLKGMERMIGEGVDNFTLLYCLSASNANNTDDIAIIKSLTKRFGKRIWKRCILVLTYCDSERSQNYKTSAKDEHYKKHLRDCARAFQKALDHTCPVRTIFECQVITSKKNEGITEVRVPPDTILAVPAARTREEGRKLNLLPGFKVGGKVDWIEYGLLEIMRKSGQYSKDDFEEMKRQFNILLTIVSVGGGVVVGAFIGGAIGIVGGPIGLGIGATVGSGIGAGVAGICKFLWSSRS